MEDRKFKKVFFSEFTDEEKKLIRIGYYEAHGLNKTPPSLGSREATIWKSFVSGGCFLCRKMLPSKG